MKYFRIIILIKDGRLLFSDVTEHFMEVDVYESGSWDKPITKVVTPQGELHFISFVRDYIDAFIAGIAVIKELKLIGLDINKL